MQRKIIELLTNEPKLTANQIIEKTQGKTNTIKVVLHKMTVKGKVVREKVDRNEQGKAGPKSVYAYSVSQ